MSPFGDFARDLTSHFSYAILCPMNTSLPCPFGCGPLNLETGMVSEVVTPANYIRGWEYPRRERPAVIVSCGTCEYAEEASCYHARKESAH